MEINIGKRAAGYFAADFIQNGMIVGLGTGSTSFFFIERLIQRIKNGLKIQAIASSEESKEQAKKGHIPLVDTSAVTTIDITVDGADEIDSQKRMIKGGGGALLREKILAASSKEMIVIVDETKVVSQLGKRKLPVEIIPFAHRATLLKLEKLGYRVQLRISKDGSPFITDNGNYIADILFSSCPNHPEEEHFKIKSIPGVVETGFFFHLAGRVIIGYQDGQAIIRE